MTKITARVLLDRVLVKPVSRVEENKGGIIVLANTAGDGAYIAEIVAVGDALASNACANHASEATIKVGDHVILGVGPLQERAGVQVLIGGEAFRVVKESDILVVL